MEAHAGAAAAVRRKRHTMDRLLKILAILTFICQGKVFACECKDLGPLDSIRKVSYTNSDIVFLGELKSSDTLNYSSFTFKILETFKGHHTSETIEGIDPTSCSFFPTDEGRWIVYADYVKKSTKIEISQCLGSRSQLNPRRLFCYSPPPPPRPNQKLTEEYKRKTKEYSEKQLMKARKDWEEELILLREMKK